LCLFAGACASQPRDDADTVYTNGKIYTVSEAKPWAEAARHACREEASLALGFPSLGLEEPIPRCTVDLRPALHAPEPLSIARRPAGRHHFHLDGETSFIVSGPWSFFGYSDFMFLMAATTWVEGEAELTELLPAGDEGSRRLGRITGKLI
jgi:hypothetical protein